MLWLFLAWTTMQLPSDDFLLAKGRAGRMEVGMTIDDLFEHVGRENTRLVDFQAEGMFSPAINIYGPGRKRIAQADVREWPCGTFNIWNLRIEDARFRTDKGIGVGSTYAQLKKFYEAQPPANGEGDVYVFVPTLEMSFGFGGTWYGRERQLPDAAKVTAVLLVPAPVRVRKERCPELGPIR